MVLRQFSSVLRGLIAGINGYPRATGTDHYVYNHEFGIDDGSTVPSQAMDSYIESSQIDIGDGDNFAFIRRLIPDITFDGSTATSPSVDFVVKTRNFPGRIHF